MSRRQGLRHSRSTGNSSGVIENIAVGLFRWAATDHSGMGNAHLRGRCHFDGDLGIRPDRLRLAAAVRLAFVNGRP